MFEVDVRDVGVPHCKDFSSSNYKVVKEIPSVALGRAAAIVT